MKEYSLSSGNVATTMAASHSGLNLNGRSVSLNCPSSKT